MSVQVLTAGTVLHSDINGYRIERFLGQGSFGITYLATTQSEGQMVAIKEFYMKDVNSRMADGSKVEGMRGELTRYYQEKFRKEAINLSHLDHSNIVKVLDVFDANNTTYYVMQYIDGQNLDDYIKEHGCLAVDEAVTIIRQVAEPLQYMHEKNMLHLDLKPRNIMLDKNNIPYLIDFGLSKQYTEDGEPETSTTIGWGTSGYAPYEQDHYKQDGTFPATLDIYALGATLYKMLLGETPPAAQYVKENGLPAQPSHISAGVWNAVVKAMQPNKTKRPQSVHEFVKLFEKKPRRKKTVNPEETIVAVEPSEKEKTIVAKPAKQRRRKASTTSESKIKREQVNSLEDDSITLYDFSYTEGVVIVFVSVLFLIFFTELFGTPELFDKKVIGDVNIGHIVCGSVVLIIMFVYVKIKKWLNE